VQSTIHRGSAASSIDQVVAGISGVSIGGPSSENPSAYQAPRLPMSAFDQPLAVSTQPGFDRSHIVDKEWMQRLEQFARTLGLDGFSPAELARLREVLASESNLRMLTPHQNRVVERAIIRVFIDALENGNVKQLTPEQAEKARAQLGVLLKNPLPPKVLDVLKAGFQFLIDPRTGLSIAEDIPWDDLEEQAETYWKEAEARYGGSAKRGDRGSRGEARPRALGPPLPLPLRLCPPRPLLLLLLQLPECDDSDRSSLSLSSAPHQHHLSNSSHSRLLSESVPTALFAPSDSRSQGSLGCKRSPFPSVALSVLCATEGQLSHTHAQGTASLVLSHVALLTCTHGLCATEANSGY
jgi:hypothetical protein